MPVLIAVDKRANVAGNGHVAGFDAHRVDVKLLAENGKLAELSVETDFTFVEAVNVRNAGDTKVMTVFENDVVWNLLIFFLKHNKSPHLSDKGESPVLVNYIMKEQKI